MTIDCKPLIYVFDDGENVSYTMADKDNITSYLTKVFNEKQKLCNSICAQMDYAKAGFSAQLEFLNICQQKPGDELLDYLKKWREQYRNIGCGLKIKNDIVQDMYDASNRMTKDKASKEIDQISIYF